MSKIKKSMSNEKSRKKSRKYECQKKLIMLNFYRTCLSLIYSKFERLHVSLLSLQHYTLYTFGESMVSIEIPNILVVFHNVEIRFNFNSAVSWKDRYIELDTPTHSTFVTL